MSATIYPGMTQLQGNLMAAVDLETTGVRAGYHDIIQIAVLPLNADLRPLESVQPFYTTIKPKYPERASKAATYKHHLSVDDLVLNAPDADKVADLFVEWVERLQLPVGRYLVPLAHNWPFESSFLKSWLGVEMCSSIFHAHARDSMGLAIAINDLAAFSGEITPFHSVSLNSMCKKLNIINVNPHDALSDCIAEAELYRTLLQMRL